MVFFPKWLFFQTFFLSNIGQENFFQDILEQKKAFLGYNNKKFKKSKNWPFSKGVNPSFWYKNGHFSKLFFLGDIGKENVFHDILEPKKAFSRLKNKRLKKSRNWHFSKVVRPSFRSKNWHFSKVFFLGNKGQENVSYDILEPKHSFLGYKNKKFKRSKNWHFSKVVNNFFWSKHDHYSNLFF